MTTEVKEIMMRQKSSGPEDATTAGIKAIVKHNEQLQEAQVHKDRILMQIVEQVGEERSKFFAMQANMVAKFTEMISAIETLKDRQADRDEKRESARASREMKEKVYSDVRQLATIGINQYAKKPMLKEGERGLLAEFLESVDADEGQIIALQQILRPGQMAAFAKMVDAVKEQEDKDAQAEKEANGASH